MKSSPKKPTAKTSNGSASADVDGALVKRLASILNDTGLTEIEYDTGALRIRVVKSATRETVVAAAPASVVSAPAAPQPVPAASAAPSPANDAASHPGAIKSPMVGVAYLSPEPGKPPFVKAGDRVSEGQTLLLIEAMKTYNPVKAAKAGTVTQIIVGDAAPVEFGEPLMIIE